MPLSEGQKKISSTLVSLSSAWFYRAGLHGEALYARVPTNQPTENLEVLRSASLLNKDKGTTQVDLLNEEVLPGHYYYICFAKGDEKFFVMRMMTGPGSYHSSQAKAFAVKKSDIIGAGELLLKAFGNNHIKIKLITLKSGNYARASYRAAGVSESDIEKCFDSKPTTDHIAALKKADCAVFNRMGINSDLGCSVWDWESFREAGRLSQYVKNGRFESSAPPCRRKPNDPPAWSQIVKACGDEVIVKESRKRSAMPSMFSPAGNKAEATPMLGAKRLKASSPVQTLQLEGLPRL